MELACSSRLDQQCQRSSDALNVVWNAGTGIQQIKLDFFELEEEKNIFPWSAVQITLVRSTDHPGPQYREGPNQHAEASLGNIISGWYRKSFGITQIEQLVGVEDSGRNV
jgi:hypothetical protein